MTQTLEQLSAAATEGRMDIAADANSHCFDGRLMVGEKCIAFVEGDQTEDEDGEYHIIADADGQFIAALWNAYRTGQLVAVQAVEITEKQSECLHNALIASFDEFTAPAVADDAMVERVARAIKECPLWHDMDGDATIEVLHVDDDMLIKLATAAIAAMKDTQP